ncbi:hypothetical protein ACHWQZ_G014790 [Mnemiopsis leidyi]
MSLGEYTADQLYDMILHPETLKSYPGFKLALEMGIANNMAFYHDLPYEEIKQFVGEEKEAIFRNIPAEIVADNEVTWEHVGSTSIKGMPGTLFPDSLILYKKYPPPREVFEALMSSGFVFIGAGPLDPADLWFLKKISREGSRLDSQIYKIHLTPCTLGASQLLIETRDRCNNNPADFEDYKNAKVAAAVHLQDNNVMGYKGAKCQSKLLKELSQKYGIKQAGPPKQ